MSSTNAAASDNQEIGELERLLDGLARGALLVDKDFSITFVNEAATELLQGDDTAVQDAFGASADQLAGTSLLHFFPDAAVAKKKLGTKKGLPLVQTVDLGTLRLKLEVSGRFSGNGRIASYIVLFERVEVVAPIQAAPVPEPERIEVKISDPRDGQAALEGVTAAVLVSSSVAEAAEASAAAVDAAYGWTGGGWDARYGDAHTTLKGVTVSVPVVAPDGSLHGALKFKMHEAASPGRIAVLEAVGRAVGATKLMVDAAATARRLTEEKHLAVADYQAIEHVLTAAVGGDLTVKVPQVSEGVRHMAEVVNSFIDGSKANVGKFVKTTQDLRTVSERLGSTASNIVGNVDHTAGLARNVSGASEEVSANVQAVASAAEEMTASISEIAQNASQAAQVAQSAVRMADDTNATITRLGGASNEIGEVIKVITSIAQQTNLLALNATIEAARAGEAGKGFAVVANEVKDLAKETARATEDIGKKIEAIQAETGKAVSAIGEIGSIIRRISEIQDNIASAVEEQSATTNEISRNAVIAAESTKQITTSVQAVADQTEAARTSVRATSGVSDDLKAMARQLQDVVDGYRL